MPVPLSEARPGRDGAGTEPEKVLRTISRAALHQPLNTPRGCSSNEISLDGGLSSHVKSDLFPWFEMRP